MVNEGADAAVQQDMERVFADLSGFTRRASEPKRSAPHQAPTTLPPERRPVWVLISALAIATGLLLSIVMAPGKHIPRPSAAPPQPAATTSSPSTIPEVVPRASTARAPAIAPSRPVLASAAAHLRRERPRRGPTSRATSSVVTATASVPEATNQKASRSAPLCQEALKSADCPYREVLVADGRLRRAYEDAVAAGVSVGELKDARRSWKRALSRSKKEPLVSAGTLNGLAETLNGKKLIAASFAKAH